MQHQFPHIVPAFHGTSQSCAAGILAHGFDCTRSKKGWYGAGAYFWESNDYLPEVPARAAAKRDSSEACIVRASIDLTDDCLDLTSKSGKKVYEEIIKHLAEAADNDEALASRFKRVDADLVDEFIVRFAEEQLSISFGAIRAITYPGNRYYEETVLTRPVALFPIRVPGVSDKKYGHALVNFGILIIVKDPTCILNAEVYHEP